MVKTYGQSHQLSEWFTQMVAQQGMAVTQLIEYGNIIANGQAVKLHRFPLGVSCVQ